MAKLSSINKNERRKKLVERYASKYAKLKAVANDQSTDDTERKIARLADQTYTYDPLNYLVVSMTLPMEIRPSTGGVIARPLSMVVLLE